MIQKLSQRFDQLSAQLPHIEATKHTVHSDWGTSEQIDKEAFSEWALKARALVANACGENGQHLKAFLEAEKTQHLETSYDRLKRLRPLFLAAKDDFQGGYLTSVKNLVQAEVFDSELDQARGLLSSGYKGPAAVVAGVVLETALRDLCDQQGLSHSKLDKMNSDLAKAGIYNKLQQKRITALADIRNNAAHGHWEAFSDHDVEAMIRDVESFLSGFLA